MKRLLGIGAGILLAALVALAPAFAIPKIMSYQGRLNDATGTPVSGTVAMTFTIWSAESGGSSLWSVSQPVQVSNGIFSVELGSDASPLPDTIFSSDTLYLGIKVGTNNEMVPRQRITSGPFTFLSKVVEMPTPVGSIMAWAKGLQNVPALPSGWMECNGQLVEDPDSPLHNVTLPDLNASRRFLRGNSGTPGVGGAETVSHYIHAYGGFYPDPGTGWIDRGVGYSAGGSSLSGKINVESHGTLPPYYDVVWIIKVR